MLQDLLDEDIQAADYSWHQMRRLCDNYNVATGGNKEDMALRLRRARDDAIAATFSPDDDEELQQPAAAKQHVNLSNEREGDDTPADNAATTAAANTSTIAIHQQEISNLDHKIEQLKKEVSRDLNEKLDFLKSPSSRGVATYIGFYNRKQDLRSWCEDGHPMKTDSGLTDGIRFGLPIQRRTFYDG